MRSTDKSDSSLSLSTVWRKAAADSMIRVGSDGERYIDADPDRIADAAVRVVLEHLHEQVSRDYDEAKRAGADAEAAAYRSVRLDLIQQLVLLEPTTDGGGR